jgi:hypothetical protein
MFNRTVQIDAGGNWVVSAGQLVFLDNEDYIIQTLKENISLFLGEYRFDTTKGMPYFQQIMIKGYNPNVIRGAFIDTILASPGIKSVNSLDLSFDRPNRSLTVTLEAQSDVGLLSTSFSVSI